MARLFGRGDQARTASPNPKPDPDPNPAKKNGPVPGPAMFGIDDPETVPVESATSAGAAVEPHGHNGNGSASTSPKPSGSEGRGSRRSRLARRGNEPSNGTHPTVPAVLEDPITPDGPLLGNLLLGQELVDPEQLDLALAEQPSSGLRLGELLIRKGILDERQLTARSG